VVSNASTFNNFIIINYNKKKKSNVMRIFKSKNSMAPNHCIIPKIEKAIDNKDLIFNTTPQNKRHL
jgi:hypothetical protein